MPIHKNSKKLCDFVTVQWQAIIQTDVDLFVNSVTAVKLVQSNWLPLVSLTKAQ